MIPPYTHSNALPPYIGRNENGVPIGLSPYHAEMTAVVDRFATTRERNEIMCGLLAYRRRLTQLGFDQGYQWIGGSFVEHVEADRGRPPGDVDVVTFTARPPQVSSAPDWGNFVMSNAADFNPGAAKATYKCDAYIVDLDQPTGAIIESVSYWCGLFSHKRDGLWKGMIRVPLQSDDAAAQQLLASLPYA